MIETRKLRPGPLPKTESTKLTFPCPANLKVDLDRFASMHAATYGDPVDAMTLILKMVGAFTTGDRGFNLSHDPGGRQHPSHLRRGRSTHQVCKRLLADWQKARPDLEQGVSLCR